MQDQEIHLLLYKGRGKIGNALIRWWTNSIYSHCEIRIGSTCYSSSLTDGGVRAKVIEIDPEHWDIIKLPSELIPSTLELFEKTKGKGYSYLDLFLDQILNRAKNRSSRYFCSEWCARAINLPNPSLYSPRTLADLVLFLIKRGLL